MSVVAAIALTAGSIAIAPGASAAENATISGAKLRWGMSAEAGGGAYFGGCNFLSAGAAGDAGSSRLWTESDGFYRTSAGNVAIVKPDAAGKDVTPTWQTKCQDANGKPVSVGNTASSSFNQAIFGGGTGTVAADGSGSIAWDGSVTIVFYGGMTYWTVSEPKLKVKSDGSGQITGTATGYGASMEDTSKWEKLPAKEIVIADLKGVKLDADGFSVKPEYLGVAITTNGAPQPAKSDANAAYWGSFPQSWVDYNELTGQSSYWYTSGGARDAAKPTSSLTVTYATASTPTPSPAPDKDQQVIGVAVPKGSTEPEPPAGEFGWTFASTSPVDLGTAKQDGETFIAAGRINDIVVTDSRTGGDAQYTWSVSGVVSAFADKDKSFSAANLGWTPRVRDADEGVTAGAAVQSTLRGGQGLEDERVLASSSVAANATAGADLELVIPTSTKPGSYTATLTITALS